MGKVMRTNGKAINANASHGNVKGLNIRNAGENTINAIIVPSFNTPIVFVYDERNRAYKIP